MELDFEWDTANRSHIARHGVSAEDCQAAMFNRIETVPDLRSPEPRYKTTGLSGGRRLDVIWTMRDGRIRVVTAWWKGTKRK